MPPRMWIVEEEVADEKRGAVRAAERQLLEGAPADEDALGAGLDEGEVALHDGRHCSAERYWQRSCHWLFEVVRKEDFDESEEQCLHPRDRADAAVRHGCARPAGVQ